MGILDFLGKTRFLGYLYIVNLTSIWKHPHSMGIFGWKTQWDVQTSNCCQTNKFDDGNRLAPSQVKKVAKKW